MYILENKRKNWDFFVIKKIEKKYRIKNKLQKQHWSVSQMIDMTVNVTFHEMWLKEC